MCTMYFHHVYPSLPRTPRSPLPQPISQHLIILPAFYNPLSPISSVCMLMGVGPSIGAWPTYQGHTAEDS